MTSRLKECQSTVGQAVIEAGSVSQQTGSKPKVLVTGCLAQRYSTELADELPEADLVMGFESYKELPTVLSNMLGEPTATTSEPRVQVWNVLFQWTDSSGSSAL